MANTSVARPFLNGRPSLYTADDVCRRHAAPAAGAAQLWELTPSLTLDTSLSRDDFVTAVRFRLGVDVSPGEGSCRFCGLCADAKRRHVLSCMSGGDATAVHNHVRDLIFDYCRRGRLSPVSEAPQLLPGLARRRPADVLLQQPGPLLDRLPDGSIQGAPRPLALDFAVINAQGPNHWDASWGAPGGAAEGYALHKRKHQNTEQLCTDAGLLCQPIVLEAQGGHSRAAASFTLTRSPRLRALTATGHGHAFLSSLRLRLHAPMEELSDVGETSRERQPPTLSLVPTSPSAREWKRHGCLVLHWPGLGGTGLGW